MVQAMTHDRKKMQKSTCLSLILSIAAVFATGCATPITGPDADKVAPAGASSEIQHIIAPGDRLSDIALRYTGQVGQWEAIATHNNITDPRTLRIGDVITIPASMLPTANQAEKDQEAIDLTGNADNRTHATSSTMALQRARDDETDTSDVKVVPVMANRSFQLQPMDASELRNTQTQGVSPPRIRVVGTYYPKGVYEQPASYSTLMMRAAPGTIFELDREVNDWYKVITSEGIGYLRSVDGKLILED